MSKKFFFLYVLSLTILSPVYAAIKVGVTAGPHAMIMEQVRDLLKKEGEDLEIVEFNDFILPNEALNNAELDANSMQHEPYLKNQCLSRGYNLISIAKTVLMPLGFYSKRIKAINDLPVGSKIAIPNDPTNGGRALLLLEKLNLIVLNKNPLPTLLDIKDNPKNLSIIELEAPQLPRSLDDVEGAFINTDWVILSGLDPKVALNQEGRDSDYVNVLVVRKGTEKNEGILKLVKAYQSDDIKNYILKEFKGAVLPAW